MTRILVDPLINWGWRYGPSCHMFPDGVTDEDFNALHLFAVKLGLKPEWFQMKPEKNRALWHFDLTRNKRIAAVKKGAEEVTTREVAAINEIKMAALGINSNPRKCPYYSECNGYGIHECPVCHELYCSSCREMFLPLDPAFWQQTAMICPQCSYNHM